MLIFLLKISEPSVGLTNVLLYHDFHCNLISPESICLKISIYHSFLSSISSYTRCLPTADLHIYENFQETENLTLKCCSAAFESFAHSSAFQNTMPYLSIIYQILYKGLLDRYLASSIIPISFIEKESAQIRL